MSMAEETPRINDLKKVSGLEKFHQIFQFLFVQSYNELQRKIEEQTERMAEVWSLNHDDEESASDVYECMGVQQIHVKRKLEVLRGLLFEIREGLTEKEEHMEIMDFYDDQVFFVQVLLVGLMWGLYGFVYGSLLMDFQHLVVLMMYGYGNLKQY